MFEHGLGWVRDLPDFRDYVPERPWGLDEEPKAEGSRLIEALTSLGVLTKGAVATAVALPAAADLRPWFSAIEDQGQLGSCTAHAGVGLLEYFERRSFGRWVDASRLFLYKATRNLLQWAGDTGAYLRTTMGALTLFGACPEEYWPYVISDFDVEPPAFCYAFAQQYQALRYFRLDPPGVSGPTLVDRVRLFAAAKLPSMFGFTVYSSISAAGQKGEIPLPDPGDRVLGGHAVAIAGFDDARQIKSPGGRASVGAFLIRNSWGPDWGAAGYGWLPYEYVAGGLATDFWSLIKAEWIESGQFGL